jgi:sec-independent protein translocase protein TatA
MQLAMLNTPEIVLILLFALVLFGAKKLPELARGLGQGIREFRKVTQGTTETIYAEPAATPPPNGSTPTHAAPATPPSPTRAA